MFSCSKNALVVRREYSKGREVKVIFCRWVGDYCMGWKCQYSYCQKRAQLPDGKCGLAIQHVAARDRSDMFEELKELEEESRTIRGKFSRRGRGQAWAEEF